MHFYRLECLWIDCLIYRITFCQKLVDSPLPNVCIIHNYIRGRYLTLAGSQGRGDDRPVAGFKMRKRQKLDKDGLDSWGWIQFQFL